jgi:hypothetical protein
MRYTASRPRPKLLNDPEMIVRADRMYSVQERPEIISHSVARVWMR